MSPHSQLFRVFPRWRPIHHRGGLLIPGGVGSWLFESGSLTQRLQKRCGEGFNLVLLRQQWQKPSAEEARVLGLKRGQRALVREVALRSGETSLVLARTVIPTRTLRGADRRLAHLGCRPLGQVLFAQPGLQRLSLELTRTGPAHWRPERVTPGPSIWGRRSLYQTAPGHPLLVAEFFLPALIRLCGSDESTLPLTNHPMNGMTP